MNDARYELRSPNNGSLLIFEIRDRNKEEVAFDVSVRTPWFSGLAHSSTFMVLSPADFFREMAAEWLGWAGEKTWSDLEQSVEIAATTDRTGHVSLSVTLNGQDAQLRACLVFEAGQLENFAKEIALLFD